LWRGSARTCGTEPDFQEGRGPRALELDIAADPVLVDDFAEEDRASVPEARHEVAELMARIGHREGGGTLRHAVARENLDPFGAFQELGVEAELLGQGPIEPDESRCGDRRRRDSCVELLGQARVAVVELERSIG